MVELASRAGEKLSFAVNEFGIQVSGLVCADFGSSAGGFTDVLLRAGAKKVYAVETGYGLLDYRLRQDPQVEVLERTNAMHVELPEKCDLITIDVSWTPQRLIIPNALNNLKEGGSIISLIKPHYEAEKGMLTKGRLEEKFIPEVLDKVAADIAAAGALVERVIASPIIGKSGGNVEYLALIYPALV